MATEIECKFLVKDRSCIEGLTGETIVQGYLHNDKSSCVRVRTKGDKAYLTVKGATKGLSRAEFEYEIPMGDARAMLNLCGDHVLSKTRYEIAAGPHVWEVDVFDDYLDGLMIAEIELTSEDEDFIRPDWLGEDVSLDPRYLNACLVDMKAKREEAFWREVSESYAAMKADPVVWAAEMEDRIAWGIEYAPAQAKSTEKVELSRRERMFLITLAVLLILSNLMWVVC